MKSITGILLLLLFSYSAYSQRATTTRRVLKKEEFIHTWTLDHIRNQTNNLITNKVEKKTLKFTGDSVFIQTNEMLYSGVWALEKGQLKILIPDCSQCDYKWTVISGKIFCFRIGEDMSRLECYRPED